MNLLQAMPCRDGCGLTTYVPVVSVCSTCNGTGWIEWEGPHHHMGEAGRRRDRCTVCVSGKVTQQGTIRRHCSVHDSWPTLAEPDLVCLQGDDDYLAGVKGSGPCEFGLVLVVPLEETT